MSDDTANATAATEKPAGEQKFSIQRLYLKDVSLESPHAPTIFSQKSHKQPKIGLEINTETRAASGDAYEVVLNITATATLDDKTVYLVEVKQAGVFLISGFPKTVREALVHSHCPSILFPFAREVIANLVGKAGFPPLLLEPINFEALYAQHKQKIKQTAPAPTTTQ